MVRKVIEEYNVFCHTIRLNHFEIDGLYSHDHN